MSTLNLKRVMGLFILIVFAGVLASAVYYISTGDNSGKGEAMLRQKRIILLGASVGKAWELPDFPKRTNSEDKFIFETVRAYQYDKTEALEEILMRPKRKFRLTKTYVTGFLKPAPQLPDTIIVKECAAYFPGDLESYKTLMTKWVKRIREANIDVVLATTVSVTATHAAEKKGRIETIRDFNDWIRDYTKKENIPLLDLEAALRTDGENRFLRDDMTSGDGLHLNQKAYGVLDDVLRQTLEISS